MKDHQFEWVNENYNLKAKKGQIVKVPDGEKMVHGIIIGASNYIKVKVNGVKNNYHPTDVVFIDEEEKQK